MPRPTSQHLRRLRAHGIVPRSAAFTTSVGFVVCVSVVPVWLGFTIVCQKDYLLSVFMNAHAIDTATFPQLVSSVLRPQLAASVFGFGVVVTVLLLFGIVQSGGIVPLRQSFSPWLHRATFARITRLVSLLFAAYFVTTWFIIGNVTSFIATQGSIARLITILVASSRRLLSNYAVCILIFGIIDLWFQWMSFRKSSKITPSQQKRDQKEQWGAPEVLARRRQLRNALTNATPEQLLDYTNLLIDDGNNVVALLTYDPLTDDTPRLLATAHGAERNGVLFTATTRNVPIIVNEWLTTRLAYSSPEVPLPVELEPVLAEAYATLEREPPPL